MVSDFRGSWSGYERDCLFHNPDGPAPRFYNCGYVYGLDFDDDGRCACPVDVDGDGDLDMVCLSLQGLRLMENTSPPRHFARVRLRATKSQPLALNAIVKVTAGGVVQQDYVRVIEGFMTQVPADLHFGLADAREIDSIEVTWPYGGTSQKFSGLPADRLIEIVEGASQPRISELPRWPDATRPRLKPAFSYEVAAKRLEGGEGPLASKGKPAVVNFWAPTCAPCKQEVPLLVAAAGTFGTEVQFAGVSTEVSDVDSVKASSSAFGMEYPQFLANDALIKSFFGAGGQFITPSTFVFDAAGRLRRVFQRPLATGELEALLASLRDEGVSGADLERRGTRLVEQDRFQDGLAVLQQAAALLPKRGLIHYHMGIAHFRLGQLNEARREFQLAVEYEPEFARSHVNLAEVFRKLRQFDASMGEYREAIRIRGDEYETCWGLGDAAASAGQDAVAVEAFDRAIPLDPKPVGALRAKAIVLGRMGRKAEQAATLKKLLELVPGDADAARMLEGLR